MTTVYWLDPPDPITCVLIGRLRHFDSRTAVPERLVEGVDWIRGHHFFDSLEAQALLAAWKLRGPPVLELEELESLYVSDTITHDEWTQALDLWDEDFKAKNGLSKR